MSKIADVITDLWENRLRERACLVIYDRQGRYRELVTRMEAPRRQVIRAGDAVVEAMETSISTLREIGTQKSKFDQLLIYVPTDPPAADLDKCRDPFFAFATCGAVFPDGDGNSFQELCRTARPEHPRQIVELFASGEPDFATVDAVGGGTGWPRLQSLLDVESATEILVALLSPGEGRLEKMKADTSWISEAKEFTASTLGFKPKTKSAS